MFSDSPFRRFRPVIFLATSTLLLSAGTSAFAGETIFAPDVSASGGWYDVNKKSTESVSTKDYSYCWAATASNLIQYWQDRYVAAGNTLPASVPSGKTSALGYESGIFDIFLDEKNWNHYIDGNTRMADPYVALTWYFYGNIHNVSNAAKPYPGTGGYWKNEYPELQKLLGENFIRPSSGAYSTWGPWASDQSKSCISIFSENVIEILSKGPAGLAANTTKFGGHSFTLWGADVDALGIVTAVYVTDSDDAQKSLDSDLRRYEVAFDNTSENRKVFLCDTDYGTRNQITDLYGLTAYPIPEPSAFGLLAGMLAAVLACSRRKRCF